MSPLGGNSDIDMPRSKSRRKRGAPHLFLACISQGSLADCDGLNVKDTPTGRYVRQRKTEAPLVFHDPKFLSLLLAGVVLIARYVNIRGKAFFYAPL
jgi:hypothetical protein